MVKSLREKYFPALKCAYLTTEQLCRAENKGCKHVLKYALFHHLNLFHTELLPQHKRQCSVTWHQPEEPQDSLLLRLHNCSIWWNKNHMNTVALKSLWTYDNLMYKCDLNKWVNYHYYHFIFCCSPSDTIKNVFSILALYVTTEDFNWNNREVLKVLTVSFSSLVWSK